MRRFRLRAGLLALVVLAMVTAGCSADVELALPSTPPETAGPTATPSPAAPQVEPTPTSESGSEGVGPGPTPTLDPLDWNGCGDGVECASLAVPLDHADPLGPRIELALARRPARSDSDRLGVLLVNPGGPGASGVDLARALDSLDDDILDRFDIVGWDPRGVGSSTTVGCNDELLAFYRIDPSPDSAAERATLETEAADAATACEDAAGSLLANITTDDTVEDLDLIRRALGEEQINYLGYSYGTLIGLRYAEAYGERVRAMVLDGVFDPTLDLESWLTEQALATEAVIDDILATCGSSCPIDTGGVFADVDELAEAGELLAADGTEVGPAAVATAAVMATYSPALWDDLLLALDYADDGNGEGVRQLSELYLGIAGFDAYTAVVCVDGPRPNGADEYEAFAERLAVSAPRVGARVANELLPCAFWPIPPQPTARPAAAPNAPPLLLVASTGDAATPYEGAQRVADMLGDHARLLTYDGAGHTIYGDDDCIDDLVNDYLLELDLPDNGTTCPG